MDTNSEENNKLINVLVKDLLSKDDAKHLLIDFTQMYAGYLKVTDANYQEDRISKVNTYLIVSEFFEGLTKIFNS